MILNRQRLVHVTIPALDAFLAEACKAVGISFDALTVCLVTNSEIARWNRIYRGKNRPTDVLSFPAKPLARHVKSSPQRRLPSRRNLGLLSGHDLTSGDDNYLGDIAIAPEVARRNAEPLGRTFDNELRILILHGILHLMGYDHEADTGQMERREKRLRRELGLG